MIRDRMYDIEMLPSVSNPVKSYAPSMTSAADGLLGID